MRGHQHSLLGTMDVDGFMRIKIALRAKLISDFRSLSATTVVISNSQIKLRSRNMRGKILRLLIVFVCTGLAGPNLFAQKPYSLEEEFWKNESEHISEELNVRLTFPGKPTVKKKGAATCSVTTLIPMASYFKGEIMS